MDDTARQYLEAQVMTATPQKLRLMLIALTVLMMMLGTAPGIFGAISGFDVFVGTVGVVLILLFIGQTLATGRRLAKMDP